MEHKSFVVDSNIFIAFYNEIDINHDNAKVALRELERSTLIIYPYVVEEVCSVLTYRLGQATAKKFLQKIRNADNVFIPQVDIDADIVNFISISKKISFTDASLIRLSQRMNASLLTFDKQMIRIAKQANK